jgi:hypothetical protein
LPVVTEFEYMLPPYAFMAFGMTRIISRAVPAANTRSAMRWSFRPLVSPK